MVFVDIITLQGLFDGYISYYRFYGMLLRYYENIVILMKGMIFNQQEDL